MCAMTLNSTKWDQIKNNINENNALISDNTFGKYIFDYVGEYISRTGKGSFDDTRTQISLLFNSLVDERKKKPRVGNIGTKRFKGKDPRISSPVSHEERMHKADYVLGWLRYSMQRYLRGDATRWNRGQTVMMIPGYREQEDDVGMPNVLGLGDDGKPTTKPILELDSTDREIRVPVFPCRFDGDVVYADDKSKVLGGLTMPAMCSIFMHTLGQVMIFWPLNGLVKGNHPL